MANEQQLLNKLLRQITTSKNYEIIESCGYRLYYTGKNIPCGCKSAGREQIVYDSSLATFTQKLLCIFKFKKHTTVNLKEYMDRMDYLFDQCISHIAYGYNFESSEYIGEIDLPYDLKRDVFNYVKSIVISKQTGVYTDSEGLTYNSIQVASAL